MELVREVFRQKWELKRSNRNIGVSLSISKSTVANYLLRAKEAGVESLEQLKLLDNEKLKLVIFPKNEESIIKIDFKKITKELTRPYVTLMLLWEEEVENNPSFISYSRYCYHFRKWKKEQKISMRQSHKAGEKAFIDYAGTTIPIYNSKNGEILNAQIFVISLGGSDYSYVEATYSQKLRDFIGSNIRAFEYFGGCPEVLVPDNLKSGVTLASKYEPVINQSYREMAKHYGCVVIPARARKPKDKAKVENAVLITSRWILAKLRDVKFFSLEELNESIWGLLEEYNNKKFQKLDYSRKSLFEEVESKELRPLPDTRFEIAHWKKVKVNIDYHITLEGCHYSVPYKLRGKFLFSRYTDKSVEIFEDGNRVALHPRNIKKNTCSTIKEHMPVAHQEYSDWSPSRMINWARTIGPSTAYLVKSIMEAREHPELGYRSCLGIMRLEKSYSKERVENASTRALKIGALTYKSMKSILNKGLDHKELECSTNDTSIEHENIRGSEYYQ